MNSDGGSVTAAKALHVIFDQADRQDLLQDPDFGAKRTAEAKVRGRLSKAALVLQDARDAGDRKNDGHRQERPNNDEDQREFLEPHTAFSPLELYDKLYDNELCDNLNFWFRGFASPCHHQSELLMIRRRP